MTGIEAMLQQPVAQAIGWALVQFVWQGALIGAATACVLAALRRSAADIRYVVSTIALALMLTMPVVTAVQAVTVASPAFGRSTPRTQTVERPHTYSARPGDDAPHTVLSSAPAPRLPLVQIERWLPAFLAVWMLGVVILTLRLLSGWVCVQRMRSRAARPATDSVDALAQRLVHRLHINRPIRLLESSLVDVPTVIGWLKPVVLLPASALAGLSPRQLEAVLAHELAHIRRHDYLVNLLQTVVETLLFYHPAVWWLSRRIRIERENCCDDLAVSLCGDPVTYATALAEMEGMRGRGRLVLAASGGSLLQRVRRLLGARPSHAGRAPGWLAAALAVVVIVGISATAVGERGAAEQVVAGPTEPEHDDGTLPPAPPAPPAAPEPAEHPDTSEDALLLEVPEPPQPPEPPIVTDDLALANARGMAVVRQRIGRPVSGDEAARRCVRRLREALPARFRGQSETLRGACEAVVSVHAFINDEARVLAEMARDAAAIAPIAVEAAAEPIAHAAEAIVAASQAGPGNLEPVLAEVSRAIEQAYRHHASRTKQPGTATTRQKSGHYTWTHDGDQLEVSYRGDIEFTEDDTDVRRMTPGAWLRIEERRRSGPDYRLEFDADRDGGIRRRFWVDGSERPFDPDGRKWAAAALPRVIRQSTSMR